MANKPWHKGAHRRLGTPVIQAAYLNPDYRCPRCGLTHAEGVQIYGTGGAKWIRGHKNRATLAASSAEYQAEHARCSAAEGAGVRNAKSSSVFDW